MVLAASALICSPTDGTARTVVSPPTVTVVSVELELPVVAQQEPPPAVAETTWRGTCLSRGENSWPDMPVTLDVHIDRDGAMIATGTLAFVDRRTRAELRGSTWGDHFHLHGKMTEVDDGTIWKLELVGRLGEDRISGSFVEIYPPSIPGSAHMCSFAWRR